jgi:ribonuclease-3
MNETDAVTQLMQRLGLPELDRGLLRRALQHPSYVREQRSPTTQSNQRLEFLGDAVLDLVLAEHLWRTEPQLTEGALTKLKSRLVRADALARAGRGLGLGEYLLLGRGEAETGGRDKASLIADCLEAIIAVVYLSAGIDAAREFVLRHFREAIQAALAEGPADDPKTVLQELLQDRTKRAPEYVTVREEGPPHNPSFMAECRFGGLLLGRGRGGTKREAEKQAAAEALESGNTLRAAIEAATAGEAEDGVEQDQAP